LRCTAFGPDISSKHIHLLWMRVVPQSLVRVHVT